MTLVLPEAVLETTTTTGTGAYTLAGAQTGYFSFDDVGNGNTTLYSAWAVDANGVPTGDREIGLGTFTLAGRSLARTTIYRSTNADAAVSWAAGTKWIAVVRPTLGTLVVRQPGGVAGTDEVQISHDGTQAIISTPDGPVKISAPNTGASGDLLDVRDTANNTFFQVGSNSVPLFRQGVSCLASNVWDIVSAANIGKYICGGDGTQGFFIRSALTSTIDCGLIRQSAKVWGITDGSTGGGTVSSVPLSPAQITADQNNYAPGVAMFYRLSTDASRTITGLSVGQVDGQVCEIWNVGSNALVLANESGSSTAANRFLTNTGANITLAANEMALLRYDATTQRWRVAKF